MSYTAIKIPIGVLALLNELKILIDVSDRDKPQKNVLILTLDELYCNQISDSDSLKWVIRFDS